MQCIFIFLKNVCSIWIPNKGSIITRHEIDFRYAKNHFYNNTTLTISAIHTFDSNPSDKAPLILHTCTSHFIDKQASYSTY